MNNEAEKAEENLSELLNLAINIEGLAGTLYAALRAEIPGSESEAAIGRIRNIACSYECLAKLAQSMADEIGSWG